VKGVGVLRQARQQERGGSGPADGKENEEDVIDAEYEVKE
jgi:hypothetical protein